MSKVFLALYSLSRNYGDNYGKEIKKTVIITGGNRGIGLAAAKQLAATGRWNVVLACRSISNAQDALSRFEVGTENVTVMPLDLADLSSVANFAATWGGRSIDCLALNAGVHTGSRSTPLYTTDGYELTVGTNHIGHFFLAKLLLPNLQRSSAGRIVYVASSCKFHYLPSLYCHRDCQ
jgi:protochlorophyllide reductase